MRAHRLVSASCLLSIIACSDSSPPPAEASGTIGPSGGSLSVASGSLEGTSIAVPAGALTDDVLVEVRPGTISVVQAWLPVGPAARIDPGSTVLAADATLILPFDPTVVPSPVMVPGDFVVRYRDGTGQLRELMPSAVDASAGRVTAATPDFGTFWVTVPDFVAMREYLPLGAGDRYTFDNGLELLVSHTTSEPNFVGRSIIRLGYTRTTAAFFGDYLTEDGSGALFFAGEFDVSVQNLQERVDGSPLLFDTLETVGSPRDIAYSFVGFRPFGGPIPRYVGVSVTQTGVTGRTSLGVPAGVFDDVVVVEVENDRTDSRPQSRIERTRYWLARGVGPVQVLFDDGQSVRLLSATVGGASIP